jgi:tetratricopeptide (TPR) repeat protein
MSRRRSPDRNRRVEPSRSGAARAASVAWWTIDGAAQVTTEEAQRLRRIAWFVIAAFAVALIAVVAGPHRIGDYFTETDFYGGYSEGARLIQQGHLDPSRYGVVGPLYEIVLALAGLAVRNLFVAAELISLVSTLAMVALAHGLIARRAGARPALFAVLFLVTNAWVFRYGYTTGTDAFAICLQTLALWLLLTRQTRVSLWLAGLAAAAAFLTRYNALYLLPAGLIALRLERRGWGSTRTFTIAFFAPIVPWVMWCIANGSHFSFQLHHSIAYEVYARSQGMVWDDYQKKLQPQFHNLWDVIARDPAAVFSRMGFNVFDHLRLDALKLLGWPVALAALFGLLLAGTSGALEPLAPLLVAGALLFLTLVPTFYAERYSLALMPVYAMLAGLCFGLPRFAFALRGRPVWIKAVLAVMPLLFAIDVSVKHQRRALAMLPVEVLEAARTLRSLAQPGDAVIARKPHLAFHAGLRGVAFPFTSTVPELADFAHRNHVRWLFISWPEVETRPRYWHLLDTTGVMPGLRPVKTTQPHPSVVYEIGPAFGELPAWYTNDTLLTLHSSRAHLMVFPNDVKALVALALVERARGDLPAARGDLEHAIRIEPANFEAHLVLGNVAIALKDVDTSIREFQTALSLEPASVDAQVGLGWALLISGNDAEAARAWMPAIQGTEDLPTLERMAELYRGLGDRANEARALERHRELTVGGAKP